MSRSERWLPVLGFEGLYEVSDGGQVRSLARTHMFKNRWGKMTARIIKGAVLKPHISFGYLKVSLSVDAEIFHKFVHVLVLEAFRGSPSNGEQSRHLDGDRANASLSNLTWGSKAENEADKTIHGTLLFGDSHPSSKLTAAQVAEIRSNYKPRRVSCRALAEKYGVTQACIYDVVAGRSWTTTMEKHDAV